MTEQDKDKLIKLAILGYYDENIKQWVLTQLNQSGLITPEELQQLKDDVAKVINESELEII